MKKSVKSAIRAQFKAIAVPESPLRGLEDFSSDYSPRHVRRMNLAVTLASFAVITVIGSWFIVARLQNGGNSLIPPAETTLASASATPEPTQMTAAPPPYSVEMGVSMSISYSPGVGWRRSYRLTQSDRNIPPRAINGELFLRHRDEWLLIKDIKRPPYEKSDGIENLFGNYIEDSPVRVEPVKASGILPCGDVEIPLEFTYTVVDGEIFVLEYEEYYEDFYISLQSYDSKHIWIEAMERQHSKTREYPAMIGLYNITAGEFTNVIDKAGLTLSDGFPELSFDGETKTLYLRDGNSVYAVDIETGKATEFEGSWAGKSIDFLNGDKWILSMPTAAGGDAVEYVFEVYDTKTRRVTPELTLKVQQYANGKPGNFVTGLGGGLLVLIENDTYKLKDLLTGEVIDMGIPSVRENNTPFDYNFLRGDNFICVTRTFENSVYHVGMYNLKTRTFTPEERETRLKSFFFWCGNRFVVDRSFWSKEPTYSVTTYE